MRRLRLDCTAIVVLGTGTQIWVNRGAAAGGQARASQVSFLFSIEEKNGAGPREGEGRYAGLGGVGEQRRHKPSTLKLSIAGDLPGHQDRKHFPVGLGLGAAASGSLRKQEGRNPVTLSPIFHVI